MKIHRGRLMRELGFPGGKIPSDFGGRFYGIPLYSDIREQTPWGNGTILVQKGTQGRRKHRVFYLCKCSVWVPVGRVAQHKC